MSGRWSPSSNRSSPPTAPAAGGTSRRAERASEVAVPEHLDAVRVVAAEGQPPPVQGVQPRDERAVHDGRDDVRPAGRGEPHFGDVRSDETSDEVDVPRRFLTPLVPGNDLVGGGLWNRVTEGARHPGPDQLAVTEDLHLTRAVEAARRDGERID